MCETVSRLFDLSFVAVILFVVLLALNCAFAVISDYLT
jgi:hypothetical protein